MNATSPLWVTVLLAVLAPTLTLLGVFLTQRAADRRAERDAELRLRHERLTAHAEQLRVLYGEILAEAHRMALDGTTADHRDLIGSYWPLSGRAELIAPDGVVSAFENFWGALSEMRHSTTERDDNDNHRDVGDRLVELAEIIRDDVRSRNSTDLSS